MAPINEAGQASATQAGTTSYNAPTTEGTHKHGRSVSPPQPTCGAAASRQANAQVGTAASAKEVQSPAVVVMVLVTRGARTVRVVGVIPLEMRWEVSGCWRGCWRVKMRIQWVKRKGDELTSSCKQKRTRMHCKMKRKLGQKWE